MVLVLQLLQPLLLCVPTANCAKIEVPVFVNYVMTCNIFELPAKPRLEDFYWFQNGRLNRGVNYVLLPHGEIPFEGISPDATGIYRCCYGGFVKVLCAEEIHLIVKAPRPDIFRNTLLNITPQIFPNSVYWLPQMLTTPLEVEMTTEPLKFECFYFVQSFTTRRPRVAWYFNDFYPEDRLFESLVQANGERYAVKNEEIVCEEDYMQHWRSHCFKSTLTIRRPSDVGRRVVFTCEVNMIKADNRLENQLSVDYRLEIDSRRESNWIYG
ncbi:unnamed protein product [Hydatigera taeniaeformis]|uniref:Ig-like domain-containing protein n=1 Tax=Hydatigena taeniaeformis TaxID=6205 RepID=A0A0R3WRA6_HYDTA|nr:unnamed protein product [Hydatigera taeniaeformis]